MPDASPLPTAAARTPVDEADRVPELDGLRGVAILLVLLLHCLNPALLSMQTTWLDDLYIRVAAQGWCGVDLFFVLSGFLITGILLRTRDRPHYFRNFYARRVLRIFPLYYAFLVVAWLVTSSAHWPGALLPMSFGYLQNHWFAAHYQDAVISGRVEHVLATWSLAVEEQFYLLWPAIVWLLPRRVLAWVVVGCIAAAPLLRVYLLDSGIELVRYLMPCRIDALAVGAGLAMLPRLPAWIGALATAAGGGAFAAMVWRSPIGNYPPMEQYGLSFTALLGGGMLVLARAWAPVRACCRLRLLRVFGKYSYAIYLLHSSVIFHLSLWLTGADSPLPLHRWVVACGSHVPVVLLFTAIASTTTLLAAMLSWHLFEKHFLALKRFFPSRGIA